ncbi:MAG TPA: aspartate--tRNA(Asn) ligase [Methanomicrobia archaeon]|nr:aspartate--tRNA(Asn) ligase [Methanomicrobia archaeon]
MNVSVIDRRYSTELSAASDGERVNIAGWVHEKRDLGGLFFLIIRDREGYVQVTFHKRTVGKDLFEQGRKIPRESVVSIKGLIRAEPKAPNGYELIPDHLDVLSVASPILPLDTTGKVGAELDTRLDARFMDVRTERTKQIFMIRSRMLTAVRNFLTDRGFVEINTPKIVSAATEGGTALFPITYFEREAFLNQSPQLYKQMLIASGLDAVFEIAPIFRAEEHDTTKHLNEATSIDVEVAFVTMEAVMQLLESLVAHVYAEIAPYPGLKSGAFDFVIPPTPFRRITYEEALDLLAAEGVELEWGEDFSTAHEHILGKVIGEHYFIIDWPCAIKPFYAQPIEGTDICDAFDLMHPRLELSSGSQRVHSYELLTERIESKGLAPESFEFYLNAFRFGMPPHAGWGLGVERLLMTLLGLENVREAVLFPRDRRRLVP